MNQQSSTMTITAATAMSQWYVIFCKQCGTQLLVRTIDRVKEGVCATCLLKTSFQRASKRCVTTLFAIVIFAFCFEASAQDCPSGKVCIDQSTANQLFNTVEQLIAAKDTIAKMLQERGASDAAINSALKTIEGWKALDEVNNTIIAKQKDVIALYERTLTLYAGLVETLEKRLAKPKSAFSKFLDAIKTVLTLAAGVALGRGL